MRIGEPMDQSNWIYPNWEKIWGKSKKEETTVAKLAGAALKAHQAKVAKGGKKKGTAKPKSKAKATGMIQHKAYSYKNKAGKMVHVAAHSEKRRK